MTNRRTTKVWTEPCFGGYSVALVEEEGGQLFILRPAGPLVRHLVHDGFSVEPTFFLTHEQGAELVNQFQKLDVRTETDAKRDGKLEATERHLTDLQKLLKLK